MSDLRILAPSPHGRLATLPAVKVRLGIASDDDAQDARLLALLSACSAAVSAAAPNFSTRQRYEERWSCVPAHPTLPLGRYPIEADGLTLVRGDATAVEFDVQDARVGLLRRAPCVSTLTATYSAGYVAPENLSDWSEGLEVAPGAWLRAPGLPFLFEVLEAGAVAESPTSAEVGAEIASGSATVAARSVEVVPLNIQALVVELVAGQYQRQAFALPAGTTALRGGDFSATFGDSGGDLGAEVCRALKEVSV